MSGLQEELLKKEEELKNLIAICEESLKNVPEGQLRIAHKGNVSQYYYRSKETDGLFKTGKYIRKENIQLAYSIAQRDYDRKLLETAKKRLKSIQNVLKDYHEDELVKVYEQMNPYRREVVTSKVVSDEMFADQWEKVEFQGNPYRIEDVEIYTEKGERVRSKSEKIIADMLYKYGIKYRYEYPVVLKGFGTVYPDFTVLDSKKRQEIYWEHLGMMDNPEYCEHALYKLNYYIKSGIVLGDRLLISYETSKRPLETAVIKKIIENINKAK